MSQKALNISLSVVIILIIASTIYVLKRKIEPINGSSTDFASSYSKPQLLTGQAGENTTYIADDNTFSFSYPMDFVLTPFVEVDDKTGEQKQNLIFKGGGDKENFQIYITKFESSFPLSISLIKSEIPDLGMEDSQDVAIDGARGVVFLSTDPQTKFKTREIWLSNNGKLYQITTYPEFDIGISSILSSWKWGK